MYRSISDARSAHNLGCGVYVSTNREGLVFFTWVAGQDYSPEGNQLRQALVQVDEFLKANDAVLISEKYFGLLKARQRVVEERENVFNEHLNGSIPRCGRQFTFIDGSPIFNTDLAGFHFLAVSHPTKVSWESQSTRVVDTENTQYLFIADVGQQFGTYRPGPRQDTESCFDAMETIIPAAGWSFNEIIRTWFYLTDILDWYDDFNSIRNRVFKRQGLMGPQANHFVPASTGISGRADIGWCHLDVLAMRKADGSACDVSQMRNPLQNEATSYGSAFSRGLRVEGENQSYLFISGTASIDEYGKTIHENDFQSQLNRTCENVQALLQSEKADLSQMVQATAFIKNREDIPIYLETARKWGVPNDRTICLIADVCRSDLLFELDGTVVRDGVRGGVRGGSQP